MITFQANQQTLKSAKLLESKARNTYPHLSTSKIRTQIVYDKPTPSFFEELKKDYSLMRRMIRESGDYYTSIIYTLAFGKIGNCTEDSMLTELIGKINGQKNIYTACIGIKKDNEPTKFLDHVVAFITDQNVKAGKKYFFKNKDAIIIDPWLNTSDFVSEYFTKLKTVFREKFMNRKDCRFATFTNDKLATQILSKESKTPREFKEKRKEYFPHTTLCLVPFIDKSLNREKIETLKETFPELVINNYRKIELSKKKIVSKEVIA